ncbi:MAG: hypothetical protein AAB708_00810, partial [Patescibacteria group bacterium]
AYQEGHGNRLSNQAEAALDRARAGTLTEADRVVLRQIAEEKIDRRPEGVVTTSAFGLWAAAFTPWSDTIGVNLINLRPTKVCGLKTGQRSFHIPKKVFVLIDGTNYELSSYIRINGELPGEKFLVAETDGGCATVSFAFNETGLSRTITPQIAHIKFN